MIIKCNVVTSSWWHIYVELKSILLHRLYYIRRSNCHYLWPSHYLHKRHQKKYNDLVILKKNPDELRNLMAQPTIILFFHSNFLNVNWKWLFCLQKLVKSHWFTGMHQSIICFSIKKSFTSTYSSHSKKSAKATNSLSVQSGVSFRIRYIYLQMRLNPRDLITKVWTWGIVNQYNSFPIFTLLRAYALVQ